MSRKLRNHTGLLFIIISFLLVSCSGSNSSSNPTDGDLKPADQETRFTIGGTVSGLEGSGLVLQNNGADDHAITNNGPFVFATLLASGAQYSVSIMTQPSEQECSLTHGTGAVDGTNVSDISVSCVNKDSNIPPVDNNPAENTYTIGGTVSGLNNAGLVLANNGSDNLAVSGNGSWFFATALADGSPYLISVATQPSNQICTVSNANGTVSGANITNVLVVCVDDSPPQPIVSTINGTVAGTIVLAIDDRDGIVASDNTAGKSPNAEGNYPFTLTDIPTATPIRIYLVTGEGVFALYFDSTGSGIPDTNVFTLAEVVTLDLGFVDAAVSGQAGRAIPVNNPLVLAGVSAMSELADTPISAILVGQWGFARLRHDNSGLWSIRNGIFTYNADGSGQTRWQENHNGITGTGGADWVWVAHRNPDGSTTVIRTATDGSIKTRRIVFSDNNNVMLLDGTDQTNRQRLRVAVRMTPNRQYDTSDLSGEYFGVEYAFSNPNKHRGSSALVSFDGQGALTQNFIANENSLVTSGMTNQQIAVATDGSVAIDGSAPVITGISAENNLVVSGSASAVDTWSLPFLMRRQDRVYSTADLAGTWAISSFEDVGGTSYAAAFGSMTCDADGNCSPRFLLQTDGIRTQVVQTGPPLSLMSDGSFGTLLGLNVPAYAGALGNNGNTLFFNTSFGVTTSRGLVIGVRCTDCTELHTGGGPGLTRLTDNAAGDWHPYWSPDGNKIVFASSRSGNSDIWVMDADGSNPVQLTTDAASDDRPFWSPDGTQILFESDRGGNMDIWKMNADGSSVVQLTTDTANDTHAAWSPDGQRIAFQSNRDGNQNIWTMNPDGSGLIRLTSAPQNDTHPMWNPDGTQIAFARNLGSNDIWVMNAGGGNAQALTSSTADEQHADWSPDGKRIVFRSNAAGNYDVWVMNADGSNHRQLTTHPANDRNPDWHPDGNRIVFRSNRSGSQEIWTLVVGP